MNDETPDGFPSDTKRNGTARERMSRDYADAPRRPVGPAATAGGGVVSQALSQFLNSDTGTRRLVYGAAGLGGVLLLGIGGWAVLGHHQSGIPVMGPPSVAMRTKPVDPGGMQLDGVTMPEADDGQAHPVPAPEKPNPTALAAQYGQEAAKADAASKAANPQQPAEGASPETGQTPQPAGTQPAEGEQQPTVLPEAGSGSDDDSAAGDSAAAAAPAHAAAKPAEQAPAAPQSEAAQSDEAPAPSAPARKAEQPKKAVAKPAAVASESVLAKPSQTALAPPSPVPAASGGKYRVQLAALQSEAQAQQEWSRLKTRYPALFGDRSPMVEKIQRDNAIFYRLRVGGFASTAETRAFCSALRERGLACAQVH